MKQTGLKNNDDELTDAYGIENPQHCAREIYAKLHNPDPYRIQVRQGEATDSSAQRV